MLGLIKAAGLAVLLLSNAGCGGGSASTVKSDNQASDQAHTTLFAEAKQAIGFTDLTASEEMHNLLERIQRMNDPNHISYVYFVSFNTVVAHYVVRGKCSSTDSMAVSPEQPQGSDSNNNATVVTTAPQLDGSYGTNEQGIFCFRDNPEHSMVTWSGTYLQSDTPLTLNSTPLLDGK